MRSFNGLNARTLIGIAATIGLFASSAQALQIEATWTGQVKGGSGRGTVPSGAGPVTTGGGGGLFKFIQNNPAVPDLLPAGTNEFLAFCIEFNENIAASVGSRTYELVDLRKAPVDASGAIPAQGNGDRMGEDKANLIATIIGTVYAGGPPDYATAVANTALAVQFAIWEIVHESLFDTNAVNFALDVFNGNASFFRENGGSAIPIRTAAQQLIVDAVALINGGKGLTADQVGLRALSSLADTDNKQDFVVWERDPGTTDVPLPAAAWLLLSGLAGLIGTARRRKTA